MKQYITTVMSTSILSTVILLISPDKWRKYIKIITGMIIMSVMIFPISKIKNIDLFDEFEEYSESDFDFAERLMKNEMEEQISTQIETKLKNDYNYDCSIEAKISINNNTIEGIDEIVVWSNKKSETIQKILTTDYGCSKIIFRKKTKF